MAIKSARHCSYLPNMFPEDRHSDAVLNIGYHDAKVKHFEIIPFNLSGKLKYVPNSFLLR